MNGSIIKWDQQAQALSYAVGLLHGLTGSGARLVVLLTQMKGPVYGLHYLLLFGMAGIGVMMLAAGLFSLPFSKK